MQISIIHPSRSRPEIALQTALEWVKSIGPVSWEYILSVDESDPELLKYQQLFSQLAIVNDNHNLVEAANAGAKQAKGDILILISDDFRCFDNWGPRIVEALKDKSGVLKTFDLVQRWIVTLGIMTRDYYEEKGYFYNPNYEHLFVDTHMTHEAELEGKLIVRNDIVFKHEHYSVKGGTTKKDAVNIKADSTWAQGEKVYLDACRNSFYMDSKPDIFAISHKPHIDWLKKKLK